MYGLSNGLTASAFAGIGGTCIGAAIAILTHHFVKRRSTEKINQITKSLIGFSGGIMIVVVCIDLIPEAYKISSFTLTLAGIILGCIIIPFLDVIIKAIRNRKSTDDYRDWQSNCLKVSMIVFLSIALHNFPEGLAVGAGFAASPEYGIKLAIVIALHNIPEGLALGVPMMAAGKKSISIIVYAFLCGIPTIIGALAASYAANISREFIGICLGFAAGAMMYVVIGELFPISYKENATKSIIIYIIAGFILGLLITK